MNKLQLKLRALGLYQLIGGALGILITLWMIDVSSVPFLILLIVLFAFSLFLYSMYCGWLLLKSKKSGLKHSKVNQLLQAVNFSMFGYAFQYISGAYLSFGVDLTEAFNLKFNIGTSTWQLNISSSDPSLILNVNVVALFLIAIIDKLQKSVEALEVEEKISELVKEQEAQPLTQYL